MGICIGRAPHGLHVTIPWRIQIQMRWHARVRRIYEMVHTQCLPLGAGERIAATLRVKNVSSIN